jgi:hypothetical protein
MAVLAKATTAQIAQTSSGCRSESWPGAGSCWEEWIDGVDVGVAIAWKWPNNNANWIANAKSAALAPSLMFDRIHCMSTMPHAGTRYTPRASTLQDNIASTTLGCQPLSSGNNP